MEQLGELADILARAGMDWSLSGGQLLSLVRDGHPLELFTDFDVDCWAQPDGWHVLEAALRDVGYRLDPRVLRGLLYRYWITHPDGRRPIDLYIWRRDGPIATCPAAKAWPARHEQGSWRWFLNGVVRRPGRPLWRRGIGVYWSPMQRLYERVGLTMHTWQVPAHFLDSKGQMTFQGVTVPVPMPVEDYLAFRYGDTWRSRDDSWVYYRDDATYVREPPRLPSTPPFVTRHGLQS